MTAFDLTGKVALVTGGNGGIGLGMAKGLADAGASVMVAGPRCGQEPPRGRKSWAGTPMRSRWTWPRRAVARAAVDAAAEKFGRLDILVNNAGINIRKPPQDYSAGRNGTAC